jgi:hypothetical protein
VDCSGHVRQYQWRQSVVGDMGGYDNVTMGGGGASCVVDLSEVWGRSGGWVKGLTGYLSPALIFTGPHLLSPCELLACAHLICQSSFTPILAHLRQPLFMLASFMLAWPILAHIGQPSMAPHSLVLLLVLVHTCLPPAPSFTSTNTPYSYTSHLLQSALTHLHMCPSGIDCSCCCCCHTHSQYLPDKVACLPCYVSGTSTTSNYSKHNS